MHLTKAEEAAARQALHDSQAWLSQRRYPPGQSFEASNGMEAAGSSDGTEKPTTPTSEPT
jgi:hypothetical protein